MDWACTKRVREWGGRRAVGKMLALKDMALTGDGKLAEVWYDKLVFVGMHSQYQGTRSRRHWRPRADRIQMVAENTRHGQAFVQRQLVQYDHRTHVQQQADQGTQGTD